MEDTQLPSGDGGRRLRGVHPPASRLAADQPDLSVSDEMIEAADGVGAAPHTGEHRVGQPPLLFQQLRLDLPGDHRLKIPDDGREGMGAHHRAQAVVGVGDAGSPLPHRLRYGVFQGGRARLYGNHLCPQQAHPVHIEGLPDGILLPHKDHALHPQECCGGGGGYAGKTVTGEEEGLAHAWDFRDVEEPVYRNRVFPDLVQGGVDVQAVGYAEDPETIYAVNFDLGIAGEDNEPVPPQETKVGGLVKEPEPPKLEGFVFTGWYKDASCTQKWDFASDKVAGNTTLYAGWKYDYQPASFPEDMTGVSFCGPEDQLAMEDRLSKVPLSFEATVKLPEALDGRGGVIIGSWMDAGYYDYDLGYVSLEVYENGAPRLYWHQERRNQPNGGVQSVVFSGVDLRQGEWIHLAVTFDPEKDTVSCYINGVLVSTVEDCEFEPVVPAQALKIGGDYRGTGGQVYDEGYNDQYFRGEIANISVWSDVRTAEQIQADVQALQADAAAVSAEGETLLASWQFDGEQDLYEDRSDRDNDVAAFVDWIDPGFAQGDYSMVALPDTQFLSEKYPDIYKKLTQWIVDHEQTYNIQAVMHMGDMVNSGNSTQWSNCADAMYLLDKSDSIDWMPMRGNHDDSNGFNQAFPYEEFAS